MQLDMQEVEQEQLQMEFYMEVKIQQQIQKMGWYIMDRSFRVKLRQEE